MKQKAKVIIPLILMLVMSLTISAYAANMTEAGTQASALKQLGLFKGVSDTDFDLDRAPTRTEALVMLIRVLGKESEALNSGGSHPFTDVAPWADKYVGYAYENGLTKGVSATEFGGDNANSDMYLTFVLRALGYNDSAGDFVWNEPDVLAESVGILPGSADTANFLRADVALVSWAALEANLKDGSQTLAKKLIAGGTFTADDYTAAKQLVGEKAPAPVKVTSLEQLKTALADPSATSILLERIDGGYLVTDTITIPAGITVSLGLGADFIIEGKGSLINNGTIEVMGADSVDKAADFINYCVMTVQNGGKITNNGAVKLLAAELADISDNGPVGGQLRINNGTFDNNGSVALDAGKVNTHGGMMAVISGVFNNSGTVTVDGFFLRILEGSFTNNIGATLTNNSNIFIQETGKFINNGTLTGTGLINEKPMTE